MRFAILTTSILALMSQHAVGGLITVSDLNADSDSGELEGTPGGDGLNGTLSILSVTPTTAQSSITALYRLSDVDIDGDGLFTETFDFSITLDLAEEGDPTDPFGGTPSTIDFSSTRETFGIGANEEFDPGESFRLSGAVLSDSSVTHDVTLDGFTSIEFDSLVGTIFTDAGSFTAVAGNNPLTLEGPEVTFVFLTGSEAGPIEDFSLQFSTTAVPEPSSLAFLILAGLGLLRRRRR